MSFSKIPVSVNQFLRTLATRAMRCFPASTKLSKTDLRNEKIARILLARPNFRLGNSILAIPSIHLFRKNFPEARIDFVGGPASEPVLAGQPINRHFRIERRFPLSLWSYPLLLRKLRRENYDLAVEVSCSQSALGAFVVGLSGARLKIGRRGKWDFWYNVKVAKTREINKYRALPEFVSALGLNAEEVFPKVSLSSHEIEDGRGLIRSAVGENRPIIGVFIGGRNRQGKRWPLTNFGRLIRRLLSRGFPVVVFVGPEERKFMDRNLLPAVPVISDLPIRRFAAALAQCSLFVSCDSGPMHLACALGIRTIAIFLKKNFNRWGPPAEHARIVFDPNGVSVDTVEAACVAEWSQLMSRPEFETTVKSNTISASTP